MLRKVVNRLYGRIRAGTFTVDENIGDRDLMSFLLRKVSMRARGLVRGFRSAYLGRGVHIVGRSHLVVGRNVVLAQNVEIDALSRNGVRLGDAVTVDKFATIKASGVIRRLGSGVEIGARSAVGAYNLVLGQGGIVIGADCLLAPFVTIVSENHRFDDVDKPIRLQGEHRQPVHIEDDVWLGAGCTVLAGVRIGRGSIVAAGAVVAKDVPPRTVVGGVPAKILASRGHQT